MKKRFFLKLLSVLVLVTLSINPMTANIFASDVIETETIQEFDTSFLDIPDNVYNKIHFYFGDEDHTTIDDMAELNEATEAMSSDYGGASAASARSIESSSEELLVTLQFDSGYMDTDEYKAFANEREQLKTREQVNDFRARLNAFSKQYHTALIQSNMSTIEAWDYNDITLGQYSPFVNLWVESDSITSALLMECAEEATVTSISISEEPEAQSESAYDWDKTMQSINAYDVIEYGFNNGMNSIVGIYEFEGVCDTSHTNLVGKDIRIREIMEGEEELAVTAHATNVTSIIAEMIPEAIFYVSNVTNDFIGVEWFIDKGCDIVNCSFGYFYNTQNSDGTYNANNWSYRNDCDAVYDYQIATSFITVIKSAGNLCTSNTDYNYNPENRITSPGYAYNVITVGGVQRIETPTQYYLEHATGASYLCSTPEAKPNICAPYYVNIPNIGLRSGTSYSAPLVAGCVALLMEHNIDYILSPEKILACIAATAKKTSDYVSQMGYFNNKVGPGVIDLQGMLDIECVNSIVNSSGENGKLIAELDIELMQGDELQIAVAWLVPARRITNTSYSPLLTDYDILVYTPSNEVLGSTLYLSNVEFIRHVATQGGVYTVKIRQCDDFNEYNNGDWISVMYNVY